MLRELNLACNLIIEMPKELGKLLNLTKLDLSGQMPGDLLSDLPIECRDLHRLR